MKNFIMVAVMAVFMSGCALEFAAVAGGLNTAYNAYLEYKKTEPEKAIEEKKEEQEKIVVDDQKT